MTGKTCGGLENNTHVDYLRVLHTSRVFESATHTHGLNDTQIHNYSLECGGCYTHESYNIKIIIHTSSLGL